MASPVPIAPNNGWNNNGQTMPPAQGYDNSGLQVRPMGLKVHYTFDKEGKVNCLARYSQTLQVQTIPLDERTAIGVVDLRVCLRAITECSPELSGQDEDYTIYALDYSEPDTPLVGQGMLSWALDSIRNESSGQPPKMVTGRVTQNLLGVFGGGNRETLEVKLKLTAAAKVQRPEPQLNMDMPPMRPVEQAMTPTGVAEWNSFIQANPQIGHSAQVSRVASPALSQGGSSMPMNRRDSFGPVAQNVQNLQNIAPQEPQRIAPIPVNPATLPPQQAPTSRPSSRSSRKRAPTGRPRGRPRKKPAEGNTSGYEDGTEGEDGPSKKRAKTTKVDKVAPNPFGAGPDSLRVAASTSGSIRNFRPVGNNEAIAGNHLQEVPRAPTPVPQGGPMGLPPRTQNTSKLRRESSLSQNFNPNYSMQNNQKPGRALSPSQEDGRSPESGAPTPNYSEDSPQDIRSSPPVARTTPYMRSSPPPSSPILPPMPQAPRFQPESSFLNDDMEGLFEDIPVQQLQALQQLQDETRRTRSPSHAPMEIIDSTGIPSQVFQLKAGPDGHEFVHIRNYNTPQTIPTPVSHAQTEAPSLPPLRKERPIQPRPIRAQTEKRPSPPTLAPTPPPTTDAIEKLPSPAAVPELTPEATEPVEEEQERSPVESNLQPVPEAMPMPQETVSAQPASRKAPKPKRNRQLARSQSTGALALPVVPASEPAGPSSLSHSTIPECPRPSTTASALRRSNSIGPAATVSVPASDPIGPTPALLHLPTPAFSEAICPPSDALPTPSSPPQRSNKNQVKKASIKQRLEQAILNGEMPPFCTNCGAINTPTWRKIWTQDRDGTPEYVEYSEKPGRVTAIDILKRDEDERPTSYRMTKKSLGRDDDKSLWLEQLLCNPCGIWLVKFKSHRPQDKWDNSFGPLGQARKRAGPAAGPRPKKSRTKSASQPNPTSEAYIATDPLGPEMLDEAAPTQGDGQPENMSNRASEGPLSANDRGQSNDDAEERSNPGSTHSRASRGSGTAKSPIAIDMEQDEQLGSTRRLLFPSPRKDGEMKVLGEVDINIQTSECRQNKGLEAEKENVAVNTHGDASAEHDDLEALFRSPAPVRPSTPPPNAKSAAHSGPFKTPTRPTPSHRPITRSVSRSLRSVRSMMSPSFQRTPTKTPRGSTRRSPRNHQVNFSQIYDTPITRAINQVLSEPNFDMAHSDFDLSSLPALDTHDGPIYDFGNLLSTDPNGMPSSPPKDTLQGFDFSVNWADWGMTSEVPVETED